MESLWDKEEFEEKVAAGLIAFMEDSSNVGKLVKNNDPSQIFNKQDMDWLKRVGIYFPPDDRITYNGEILTDIDELPQYATIGFCGKELNSRKPDEISGYIEIFYVKRLKRINEAICKRTGPGDPYVICMIYPQANGSVISWKEWITITDKGKTYPTKLLRVYGTRNRYEITKYNSGATNAEIASVIMNYHLDRQFLWNVEAVENGKVIFGVYESQIQSLFYARNLPQSNTGKKRPILHWVRAHKRRIKEGIEIDVEKHLRGINEFVMDNTLFRITRPLKN